MVCLLGECTSRNNHGARDARMKKEKLIHKLGEWGDEDTEDFRKAPKAEQFWRSRSSRDPLGRDARKASSRRRTWDCKGGWGGCLSWRFEKHSLVMSFSGLIWIHSSPSDRRVQDDIRVFLLEVVIPVHWMCPVDHKWVGKEAWGKATFKGNRLSGYTSTGLPVNYYQIWGRIKVKDLGCLSLSVLCSPNSAQCLTHSRCSKYLLNKWTSKRYFNLAEVQLWENWDYALWLTTYLD